MTQLAPAGPTHAQLVERAGRWLLKTMRYPVVLLEPGYGGGCEVPDVLGFEGGRSILIECKASRSDFLSDKKKVARTRGGMGAERWYFAPRGMIAAEEVPEGWGLLELRIRSDRVFRTVRPPGGGDARGRLGMLDEVRLLSGCMAYVQHRQNGYFTGSSRHREQNFGGLL